MKMRRENKYKVTQSDHSMCWSWSAVIPISTLPCVELIEIIEKLFYIIQKKENYMNYLPPALSNFFIFSCSTTKKSKNKMFPQCHPSQSPLPLLESSELFLPLEMYLATLMTQGVSKCRGWLLGNLIEKKWSLLNSLFTARWIRNLKRKAWKKPRNEIKIKSDVSLLLVFVFYFQFTLIKTVTKTKSWSSSSS